MAKVTFIAGIASLHGKVGDVYYRTTQRGEVVMCRMPRKTTVTASTAQKKQREHFSKVMKQVSNVMRDKEQRAAMEVLYRQYGKRNETFQSFIFKMVRGGGL